MIKKRRQVRARYKNSDEIEFSRVKYILKFLAYSLESKKSSYERIKSNFIKTNITSMILIAWLVIGCLFFIKNLYIVLGQFDLFFVGSDVILREKVYGDIYRLSLKLQEEKYTEPLVLLSKDGWDFFLLRYLIYPRKIIWIKDTTSFHKSGFKSGLYVVNNTSDYSKGLIREKYLMLDDKEMQIFLKGE